MVLQIVLHTTPWESLLNSLQSVDRYDALVGKARSSSTAVAWLKLPQSFASGVDFEQHWVNRNHCRWNVLDLK